MNKPKQIGKIAAATVLAMSILATGMFNTRSASAEEKKYYTDFATYEEELEYAGRLNREIFADSVVLMKNEKKALPLNVTTESNISVVGMLSYNTVTGGTGSGAGKQADLFRLKTVCRAQVSILTRKSRTFTKTPLAWLPYRWGSW